MDIKCTFLEAPQTVLSDNTKTSLKVKIGFIALLQGALGM